LHGNARKKEKTPAGEVDQNVFDIMAGVSIIIGVKNNTKTEKLGEIFHTDV
jgi:predicted helicase